MQEYIQQIVSKIARGHSHGQKSPHKLIFLLTLAKLCEKADAKNRFVFNEELEKEFESLWKRHITWIAYSPSLLELPFNYLQSDKIWFLVPKKECVSALQTFSRLTRQRIIQTIEFGYLENSIFNLLCQKGSRDFFVEQILKELNINIALPNPGAVMTNPLPPIKNHFVCYLNTLNSLDGDSDGALAEKQSLEKAFCHIHVPHPLVDKIYEILTCQGGSKHVILTGHAGDGKSTMALELYKRLKKLPMEVPLEHGLKSREDLDHYGIPISIIKDLSEWSIEDQDRIWSDITSSKRRFVLVSNTGSLLSLISRNAGAGQSMLWEEKILAAMDSSQEKTVEFDRTSFVVYNLALRDNFDIATQLWAKMTTAPDWEKCNSCPAMALCPIYRNISLIQKYSSTVSDRLGLLLHRISTYGSRLTMRQISAHFSYMLCSGYNCSQMHELVATSAQINYGDYFFFNHFFGDNALNSDFRANQLKAVKIIRAQNFESHFSPAIERYFWLRDQKGVMSLEIPELAEYYDKTMRSACAEITSDGESQGLSSIMARRQIRRMFFFLHTPTESNQRAFEKFMGAFLNSEMLMQYNAWKQSGSLAFETRSKLQGQLFQVLQEHFCGIRIPDGSKANIKTLYITLARKEHNIRQSAQLVLGKINFGENFTLKIADGLIILQGKSECTGINLELTLPLWDYITNRKNGGIGSVLQSSYVDRLEKFKNDVLRHCSLPNDDGIILLRQVRNYDLYQYHLRMEDGKLEVSND